MRDELRGQREVPSVVGVGGEPECRGQGSVWVMLGDQPWCGRLTWLLGEAALLLSPAAASCVT